MDEECKSKVGSRCEMKLRKPLVLRTTSSARKFFIGLFTREEQKVVRRLVMRDQASGVNARGATPTLPEVSISRKAQRSREQSAAMPAMPAKGDRLDA